MSTSRQLDANTLRDAIRVVAEEYDVDDPYSVGVEGSWLGKELRKRGKKVKGLAKYLSTRLGGVCEVIRPTCPDFRVKLRRSRKEQIDAVNTYFERYRTTLDAIQDMCDNLVGEHRGTLTACRNLLREKKVFINIFDYVAGDYDKQVSSLRALCKLCRVRKPGYFPLKLAKSCVLKELLEKVLPRRARTSPTH